MLNFMEVLEINNAIIFFLTTIKLGVESVYWRQNFFGVVFVAVKLNDVITIDGSSDFLVIHIKLQ